MRLVSSSFIIVFTVSPIKNLLYTIECYYSVSKQYDHRQDSLFYYSIGLDGVYSVHESEWNFY